MRGLLDITRELLAADVPHEVVHLRRRIDDAAELPDVLDLPGGHCLGVRLYDADGALAAALLPAATYPATTALARALGARSVRLAGPGLVSEVTEFQPSLVPPVLLPRGMRVVADAGLARQEVVYTATGDGSTALKIRTADLLALAGATVAPLVEPGAAVLPAARAAEDDWRGTPLATGTPRA
jgi:prolyl-tRNA editing enzyme YbaK/EbsC (Cys-tRNA(Pro) deacylase)